MHAVANQPNRRPTKTDIDLTQPEHRRRADDVPLSAPALVMFRDGMSGKGYRQFETVEAALEFVENLRNDADITEMRIFRLEEVEFSFVQA